MIWPSGLIMFWICVIFNSWTTTTVAGSWSVTKPRSRSGPTRTVRWYRRQDGGESYLSAVFSRAEDGEPVRSLNLSSHRVPPTWNPDKCTQPLKRHYVTAALPAALKLVPQGVLGIVGDAGQPTVGLVMGKSSKYQKTWVYFHGLWFISNSRRISIKAKYYMAYIFFKHSLISI